jgi:hypothetical protein
MNAKKNSYAYVVSDCLCVIVSLFSLYLIGNWSGLPIYTPELAVLYIGSWLLWFAFTGAYYQPLAERSRLNEWSITLINTLSACLLLHLFFPNWFPSWSNWFFFLVTARILATGRQKLDSLAREKNADQWIHFLQNTVGRTRPHGTKNGG